MTWVGRKYCSSGLQNTQRWWRSTKRSKPKEPNLSWIDQERRTELGVKVEWSVLNLFRERMQLCSQDPITWSKQTDLLHQVYPCPTSMVTDKMYQLNCSLTRIFCHRLFCPSPWDLGFLLLQVLSTGEMNIKSRCPNTAVRLDNVSHIPSTNLVINNYGWGRNFFKSGVAHAAGD